jgi:hypothetical protein
MLAGESRISTFVLMADHPGLLIPPILVVLMNVVRRGAHYAIRTLQVFRRSCRKLFTFRIQNFPQGDISEHSEVSQQ